MSSFGKDDPRIQKLELLQARKKMQVNLPHLYGWKNYPWMREFLECTNRTVLLTAANQIGKSSVQIRKVIDWATNKTLWPILWPGRTPRVFWYMYPSSRVATAEFNTKWVPDFMPRNEHKNHPMYGWKAQYNSKREIESVIFNSGVTLFFKTYAQNVQDLQTASVHYVATDEELPEDLWGEINFRRNAVDGYFSMVFTATLAQEFWRKTMEPTESEGLGQFPNAWKKQVSIFDCKKYEDGTPSHWTEDKIQRTIDLCATDAEIQKRIYGRFIADSGRKYANFERTRNVVKPFRIPNDWFHFAGVDIGSGGDTNHPGAISFIAVKPDYSYGVVYKHWRGDGEVTTAGDIANIYREMRGNTAITSAWYDFASRDFKTITDRMEGLFFQPAEKSHLIGEKILNTLFKHRMLDIFEEESCEKICAEFMAVKKITLKKNAKDDSIDSVRYGVVKIPWDFSKIEINIPKPEETPIQILTEAERSIVDRNKDRDRMLSKDGEENDETGDWNKSVEENLNEWDSYANEEFE